MHGGRTRREGLILADKSRCSQLTRTRVVRRGENLRCRPAAAPRHRVPIFRLADARKLLDDTRCILQINRVDALSEPVINRREQRMRFGRFCPAAARIAPKRLPQAIRGISHVVVARWLVLFGNTLQPASSSDYRCKKPIPVPRPTYVDQPRESALPILRRPARLHARWLSPRARAGMHRPPTFANAIFDRLVHNAYKLKPKGESMRKTQGKFIQRNHHEA